MEKVAECSFSLNIQLMKIIGLYPCYREKFYKIYARVMYVLALIPVTILSILRFVFSQDFSNFTYNDIIMVAMVFYTLKFLPFVRRGDKIKKCIHYFDDPYYTVVKAQQKKIIQECVNICRRNSRVFFVGCVGSLTGFYGQTVFNIHQLPLNVWIPTIVKEKAQYFYTVDFLVVLGATYAGLASSSTDPLIGGLAHLATAQLQVLKEYLQDLDVRVEESFESLLREDAENFRSKRVYLKIKKCIQLHQKIINFVDEYQQCFSPVVFSQLAGSGLIIGLLCFQMSKVSTVDVSSLIMMNYLGVLLFQIFFYCYYGTLLIEESNTLPTAVFMSTWYSQSIYCQRALNTLMERAQKPMVVTAGKLFDLSLDTFVTILKRAYSLLAVLKNY